MAYPWYGWIAYTPEGWGFGYQGNAYFRFGVPSCIVATNIHIIANVWGNGHYDLAWP